MIRVTVQGTVYDFDENHLLIAEAREMKTLTGLTPPKWGIGVEEGDPDAVAALVYMAKKRAGETLRFSDLDSLDFADINLEVLDEPQAETGEATAAAGPTDPPPNSGTTQMDGTGGTSVPSPTTSSTVQPTSTP
ncbi:hypothetical protein AB0907_23990 [Streptomyces sp. NPDC006975]|uniref:hypothetical protein n=1 Tax=Streptomyces sp. NPDC006975 TaxID=3154310 RepID=UPI0034530139